MIQRRGGPRFALEALHHAAAGSFRGELFKSDFAAKPRVFCFIDNAHAAAAQLASHAIVRDGGADGQS